MHEQKARWELHKNATRCYKQIMEATSHKTTYVRPPTSHLKTNLDEQYIRGTVEEARANS